MTQPHHPDLKKVKEADWIDEDIKQWCQNQWKKVQKVPAIPVLLGALVVTQLPGFFSAITSPHIYANYDLALVACQRENPNPDHQCLKLGNNHLKVTKWCSEESRLSSRGGHCLANNKRYYFR